MEPRLQPVFTRETSPQVGGVLAERQNRVLRNTYWLLALSMLPTIAGAWVGMQLNFLAFDEYVPAAGRKLDETRGEVRELSVPDAVEETMIAP
jgi:type VI protein secretion system component VasF